METLNRLMQLPSRRTPEQESLTYRRLLRPRDNQRQRLYDAEREAFGAAWNARIGDGSIAAAQRFLNDLCREAWFQSRFGQQQVSVRFKAHGRATGHYASHICLPPWARTAPVIVHELAHVLCLPEHAPHGPEFAALYLMLVKHALGDGAAKDLRAAFMKHKVAYRSGVKTLPKAGSRKVVTQKEVKTKARAAALKPLHRTEALTAATLLKRAVNTGVMGKPGTKQRQYALSAIRLLERHP